MNIVFNIAGNIVGNKSNIVQRVLGSVGCLGRQADRCAGSRLNASGKVKRGLSNPKRA